MLEVVDPLPDMTQRHPNINSEFLDFIVNMHLQGEHNLNIKLVTPGKLYLKV